MSEKLRIEDTQGSVVIEQSSLNDSIFRISSENDGILTKIREKMQERGVIADTIHEADVVIKLSADFNLRNVSGVLGKCGITIAESVLIEAESVMAHSPSSSGLGR